jgi:hypothetical protein
MMLSASQIQGPPTRLQTRGSMMSPKEYDSKIEAVLRYYEPLIRDAAARRDYSEFDQLKQSERSACEQIRAESFGRICYLTQ